MIAGWLIRGETLDHFAVGHFVDQNFYHSKENGWRQLQQSLSRYELITLRPACRCKVYRYTLGYCLWPPDLRRVWSPGALLRAVLLRLGYALLSDCSLARLQQLSRLISPAGKLQPYRGCCGGVWGRERRVCRASEPGSGPGPQSGAQSGDFSLDFRLKTSCSWRCW